MTGNRVLIFANPIAGRGLGETIARRVEGALSAQGFEAQLWLQPPGALQVDQLQGDVRAAIVIGGDGTVRSVAQRLYDLSQCSAITIPPLLIIPLGTANLMGRHLGLEWDDARLEEQVVHAVRDGGVVQLDAASANGQLFLLMVGVGFDAAVVHELSRVRRGPISYFSYIEPTARIATSYAFPSLGVQVDGKWVFGPERGAVFVGNVPEYGTGFPMLPLARPDDGLLDICCMPCASLPEAFRMVLRAAAGEHLKHEDVWYGKGKRVRIEGVPATTNVPVQIDGDAAGFTPIDIELLPVRLGLVVQP